MKNIIFLTGHYGSGKSEVAINLSLLNKVDYLIDLDIINPYFRTRELEQICSSNEIKLISSSIKDGLGSDLPYISKEIYIPFITNKKAVYDLGGDPVGAKLINQFSEFDFKNVHIFLVINVFREETSDCNKIIKLIKDIENCTNRKITGLINNSNLLRKTSYEDILYGQKVIDEVSESTNLKIMYTSINKNLLNQKTVFKGKIIPLNLFLRKEWM